MMYTCRMHGIAKRVAKNRLKIRYIAKEKQIETNYESQNVRQSINKTSGN